jgi:hypothetical protein
VTAASALRNWRQLLAIRNWRPRLRARHGIRVAIVLTAASFWAVAVLLYGPKRSLFAASAWFVALAIKDATNIRVRGPSEQLHGWTRWRWPLAVDFGIAALRGALVLLAAYGYSQLHEGQPVAHALVTLSWAVLLWPRETVLRVAVRSGVGGATTAASLIRNLVGLSTMALLRWRGYDSGVAVSAALLAREAVAVLVLWIAILFSRTHGLRLRRGFDDEDGVDMIAVATTPDRTVSPLRGFILDNFAWSRWRMVQYFSRQMAGGVLGPVGNLAVRIGWVFKTPKQATDLPTEGAGLKRVLAISGTLVGFAILAAVAAYYGMLPALKLAGIAYVARFVALGVNYAAWAGLKRSDLR